MKRSFLLAGIVIVACSAVSVASSANDSAETGAVTAKKDELPSGPNFALYKASCLTCHTSSYVIKTPKSPRGHWEMEVKKMVDLYDAPINDADQKLIVDYLMSVRGLPEKPAK